MTSAEIVGALSDAYRMPEYAFLTEVRNSVGFQRKIRTADAMAMSLWPSRGLYMTGFEVKVSRADWKKEMEQPEKAEELARFCKRWFVVCPDGLIKKDEVPVGWGLIYVREGKSLKYEKPAPDLPMTEDPTWILFASLMRDVAENWTPNSLIEKRVSAEKTEYQKQLENSRGYEYKQMEKRLATLQECVSVFETASGIRIDKYSAYFNGEIGKAVAAIRQWNGMPSNQLATMQAQVARLHKEIGEVITAIGDAESSRLPSA